MEIAKRIWGEDYFYEKLEHQKNRLFKGKTHCSCPMCSAKTKTCGWKPRDKRILDGMLESIKGYEYETESELE